MTIDLSQLTPPDVVEEKTVDELTAEWLAELHAEDATLGFDTATEGDPLYSLARLFATQELAIVQRSNESVRKQILSAASGTSLDGLGAMPDLVRLEGESDTAYRGALHRAPAAFGTGSKERYERAVLLADTRIDNVYADTPTPTDLDVEWLPKEGVNPADHTEIETNIGLQLERTDPAGYQYRMLTDAVTITEATVTSQDLTAYLHVDRVTDPQAAIDAATANVEALGGLRQVRAVIAQSALYAALDVAGVLQVDITTPAADVGPTAATAYEWGTITITAGLASWL